MSRLIQRVVWNSDSKTATVTMSVREARPQIALHVVLPKTNFSEYFFTENAAHAANKSWSDILELQGYVRGDFELETVDSYRPHIR